MRIASKLAICFALLAIVPLALSALVFMRSTAEVGADMSARAKAAFSDRLTESLTRSTGLGVAEIDAVRDGLARDVVNLAAEAAGRQDDTPDPELVVGAKTQPFMTRPDVPGGDLDLVQASIRLEDGANQDQVASELAKLGGLDDVGRTTYLRHQGTVTAIALTLEAGVSIWFPGGSYVETSDLRESDWYLDTAVNLSAGWFPETAGNYRNFVVAAPVLRNSGSFAGVVRLLVDVEGLLNNTFGAAALPKDATAYLVSVPKDHPNLFPHEIAVLAAGAGDWHSHDHPQPFPVLGDDAWLKVISDMRSGVAGLEFVEREGRREVWSFQPMATLGGDHLYLAASLPQTVINDARTEAGDVVDAAFRLQLRDAAAFSIVAGLLAVLLALYAAKTLTGPIRQLHNAAARLAGGDFSVRVKASGKDEIADLAKGFNNMAPALEEQVRVNKDLMIAREVQQHLLPNTTPRLDGWDIAGRAEYCDETGGDYLDFVQLSDGRSVIAAVGDATGHGMGAALQMTTARAAFRAYARRRRPLSELLGNLNHDLVADSTGGRFLTLFAAEVAAESRSVRWVSAGHEPAIVFDPSADTWTMLEGDGIPLGVDADWAFNADATDVTPGSVLIAYSDGLREAKNAAGERFGIDRMQQALRASADRGADAIAAQILSALHAFLGDAKAHDDVTLLVLKAL